MTTDPRPWDFTVSVNHPGYRDRVFAGVKSRVAVAVNRRLKSGRIDFVELSADEAYQLAELLLAGANNVARANAKPLRDEG